MKKSIARAASATLKSSAHFFASVIKLGLYSPEIPQELRK